MSMTTVNNRHNAEQINMVAGHRALFSGTWQQRDAALQHMAAAMEAGRLASAAEPPGARDLWRALVPALTQALKDKVASIVTGSLKVRLRFDSHGQSTADQPPGLVGSRPER